MGLFLSARLRDSCGALDRPDDEMADRRGELRPFHLHRPYPVHRRNHRYALSGGARPALGRAAFGPGVERHPAPAAALWLAVIAIVALVGHHAGGIRLAALVTACFGFLALFGQWTSAMVTLASIVVAVPIGVVVGLFLGLAGWRWPLFEQALVPLLDLMQTIPVFAYLVPVLVFFGFGPTAAIVATLILCPAADGAHHHPRHALGAV